ncbi:hypothetical protein ACFQYP_08970 [Nonomuraea antimicrobica]
MNYKEQLLMELKAEITDRVERRRGITRRLYAGARWLWSPRRRRSPFPCSRARTSPRTP